MLKDATGKISGVFFESVIDHIKEGACYDITKMRVQKYQDNRVLKSTENTEVSENKVLDLVKTDEDNVDVSVSETKMAAKVVSIDLKTLSETYQCSECNAPVVIRSGLAWCDACSHVSTQSVCKSKAFVSLGVVTDSDPSRYPIRISHSLIEKKFDFVISNTTSEDIVPKLINKKFLFTIDNTNQCITFEDC